MTRTLDVESLLTADAEATAISRHWDEWSGYRQRWMEERRELRNYIYATDTRTTSNRTLPWSNSTTTPKLTQIYDNLKANYTATLFPNSKWLEWKASTAMGAAPKKAKAVRSYMKSKLAESDFEGTVDKLVDDWILTGNCFATIEWVDDTTTLPDGSIVEGYVGPKAVRISPFDIVFDPTAADFESTPKIVRSLKSLGEVHRMVEDGQIDAELLQRILHNRSEVANASQPQKSDGYIADGFGSIENYYNSSVVEFLTFYGDLFDKHSGNLQANRVIQIIDRAYVVSNEVQPSWLGKAPIFHSGWRNRPDNLYAMGPLDNLVGMQYRLDHLENLKADVFDQIALPMLKVRGDVQDFEYSPGGRVYLGEEGDVAPLVPDTTALQADFQISTIEQKMEDMAGAPRNAMGIRTAGEKTAFEVQTLESAASRIFTHKTSKFEKEFLERLLNAMFEAARRNMIRKETVLDESSDGMITRFLTVTREDITERGRLRPMGARHFAERAQRVQTLNSLVQVKAQDPSIGVHLSGKVIARIYAEELREEDLFAENIGIDEANETQAAQEDAMADAEESRMIKQENGL